MRPMRLTSLIIGVGKDALDEGKQHPGLRAASRRRPGSTLKIYRNGTLRLEDSAVRRQPKNGLGMQVVLPESNSY
jgi:hypothetical protein